MKYFPKIIEKYIEFCQFHYFRVLSENNFRLNCIKNQFSPNFPFLFHLRTSRKLTSKKISENHQFSNVFRGFRNRTFAENGSIEFIPIYIYIYIYIHIYIIYIYMLYIYNIYNIYKYYIYIYIYILHRCNCLNEKNRQKCKHKKVNLILCTQTILAVKFTRHAAT